MKRAGGRPRDVRPLFRSPRVQRTGVIAALAGSSCVFTVSSAILAPISWPTTVEKR